MPEDQGSLQPRKVEIVGPRGEKLAEVEQTGNRPAQKPEVKPREGEVVVKPNSQAPVPKELEVALATLQVELALDQFEEENTRHVGGESNTPAAISLGVALTRAEALQSEAVFKNSELKDLIGTEVELRRRWHFAYRRFEQLIGSSATAAYGKDDVDNSASLTSKDLNLWFKKPGFAEAFRQLDGFAAELKKQGRMAYSNGDNWQKAFDEIHSGIEPQIEEFLKQIHIDQAAETMRLDFKEVTDQIVSRTVDNAWRVFNYTGRFAWYGTNLLDPGDSVEQSAGQADGSGRVMIGGEYKLSRLMDFISYAKNQEKPPYAYLLDEIGYPANEIFFLDFWFWVKKYDLRGNGGNLSPMNFWVKHADAVGDTGAGDDWRSWVETYTALRGEYQKALKGETKSSSGRELVNDTQREEAVGSFSGWLVATHPDRSRALITEADQGNLRDWLVRYDEVHDQYPQARSEAIRQGQSISLKDWIIAKGLLTSGDSGTFKEWLVDYDERRDNNLQSDPHYSLAKVRFEKIARNGSFTDLDIGQSRGIFSLYGGDASDAVDTYNAFLADQSPQDPRGGILRSPDLKNAWPKLNKSWSQLWEDEKQSNIDRWVNILSRTEVLGLETSYKGSSRLSPDLRRSIIELLAVGFFRGRLKESYDGFNFTSLQSGELTEQKIAKLLTSIHDRETLGALAGKNDKATYVSWLMALANGDPAASSRVPQGRLRELTRFRFTSLGEFYENIIKAPLKEKLKWDQRGDLYKLQKDLWKEIEGLRFQPGHQFAGEKLVQGASTGQSESMLAAHDPILSFLLDLNQNPENRYVVWLNETPLEKVESLIASLDPDNKKIIKIEDCLTRDNIKHLITRAAALGFINPREASWLRNRWQLDNFWVNLTWGVRDFIVETYGPFDRAIAKLQTNKIVGLIMHYPAAILPIPKATFMDWVSGALIMTPAIAKFGLGSLATPELFVSWWGYSVFLSRGFGISPAAGIRWLASARGAPKWFRTWTSKYDRDPNYPQSLDNLAQGLFKQ